MSLPQLGVTVHQRGRCGYQLLTADETARGMAPMPWGASVVTVCASERDCDRRIRDGVNGRIPPAMVDCPGRNLLGVKGCKDLGKQGR